MELITIEVLEADWLNHSKLTKLAYDLPQQPALLTVQTSMLAVLIKVPAVMQNSLFSSQAVDVTVTSSHFPTCTGPRGITELI